MNDKQGIVVATICIILIIIVVILVFKFDDEDDSKNESYKSTYSNQGHSTGEGYWDKLDRRYGENYKINYKDKK